MARKTKEEALVTRARILDAAETLFQAQGVAGTSLQDIAAAAGVTRGAIYWHFDDKGALFNAMLDRAFLPLEERATQLAAGDDGRNARERLAEQLNGVFERFAVDAQMRRVFEIATQKVEYVDELLALRERHRGACLRHVLKLEALVLAARRDGSLPDQPGRGARAMAIGLHALVDGLLQAWMLDPDCFDLAEVGRQVLGTYLAGLAEGGAPPLPPAPARPQPSRPSSHLPLAPAPARRARENPARGAGRGAGTKTR